MRCAQGGREDRCSLQMRFWNTLVCLDVCFSFILVSQTY
jgi:hypothetical protein